MTTVDVIPNLCPIRSPYNTVSQYQFRFCLTCTFFPNSVFPEGVTLPDTLMIFTWKMTSSMVGDYEFLSGYSFNPATDSTIVASLTSSVSNFLSSILGYPVTSNVTIALPVAGSGLIAATNFNALYFAYDPASQTLYTFTSTAMITDVKMAISTS